MIKAVSKVIVPVDDQEQAKEFWATRIGFRVTQDEPYGDERWIELAPPDGGRSPRCFRSRRCSSPATTSARRTGS